MCIAHSLTLYHRSKTLLPRIDLCHSLPVCSSISLSLSHTNMLLRPFRLAASPMRESSGKRLSNLNSSMAMYRCSWITGYRYRCAVACALVAGVQGCACCACVLISLTTRCGGCRRFGAFSATSATQRSRKVSRLVKDRAGRLSSQRSRWGLRPRRQERGPPPERTPRAKPEGRRRRARWEGKG